MSKILTETVSAGPLFEWFAADKNNRARLRTVGYSDGRITNWKSRGIPRGEVGNVAPLMGMTYEEYVHAAEAWQLRIKKLRRVATIAAFWLCSALLAGFNKTSVAAPSSPLFNNNGAEYTLCRIRRWLSSLSALLDIFQRIFGITDNCPAG
jgi:hypothetical protein